MKTDKGKSVNPGNRQQVIIKGKRGLLKMMLPVNKILRGTTGDGKIPLTDTKVPEIISCYCNN